MEYINLTTFYGKMLHYNNIGVSEGIDTNKSNKSKESMIYYYCILKKLVISLNHIFVINVMMYH